MNAWWQQGAESKVRPGIWLCPCGVPIQRTPGGSLRKGIAKHIEIVHEGRAPADRVLTGAVTS